MRIKLSGWTPIVAAVLSLSAIGGAMIAAEPLASPAPVAAAALPIKAAAPALTELQPAAVVVAPAPAFDERFVIRRILPIDGPIRYGEWHWDEANVPAGPIVVTVDLDARVLSVFQNGYEIGATAVLLGTEDKPTPLGVFPITQKDAKHVSNLYDAPMPYMQRLTNDGITLHATNVQWGYASHGCIGMPLEFAARLFGKTAVGDRVFITRGKNIGMGDALVSG